MKLKIELDSTENFDAMVIKFVKSDKITFNELQVDASSRVTTVNYSNHNNDIPKSTSNTLIEGEDESFKSAW